MDQRRNRDHACMTELLLQHPQSRSDAQPNETVPKLFFCLAQLLSCLLSVRALLETSDRSQPAIPREASRGGDVESRGQFIRLGDDRFVRLCGLCSSELPRRFSLQLDAMLSVDQTIEHGVASDCRARVGLAAVSRGNGRKAGTTGNRVHSKSRASTVERLRRLVARRARIAQGMARTKKCIYRCRMPT